jgi:hypothetical protein
MELHCYKHSTNSGAYIGRYSFPMSYNHSELVNNLLQREPSTMIAAKIFR